MIHGLFPLPDYFYVHLECSWWSHGVRLSKEEPADAEEKDKEETESELAARRLENMENVVLKAALNKCTYCKHHAVQTPGRSRCGSQNTHLRIRGCWAGCAAP